MNDQANLLLRGRNPDVLSCIANLSNDEVFTPPKFANQMLDTLTEAWAADHNGESIWSNEKVAFLDPCTKSGVFLREITRRLNEGLSIKIPDLQERVDHILCKQVFGIAVTHLTSMMARRSLYCSKHANGKHSIATNFTNESGNVWFERTEHKWSANKCEFCGVPKKTLDRDSKLENYAYAFIHTNDINARIAELFGGNMNFDVIIGNPPYQMKDGAGGSSDSSIYHFFVAQAKKLAPKYLSMVIPSRWLAGGRNLGEFRKDMLTSNKIQILIDYPVSREVFPNVEVKGGICYFLWSDNDEKECSVTVVRGKKGEAKPRKLDEFDIFVRDERSASILRKVLNKDEKPIKGILTADTPFGIATNSKDFHSKKKPGDVALHYVQNRKRGTGFIARSKISKNTHLIDKWKLLVPEAGSDGGQKLPDRVLGKPWLIEPLSVCTQSFLAFWTDTAAEANSLESYYCTKFFRHLVSLRKLTQHALNSTYTWVPAQTWDRTWTDEALYKKYGLTKKEVEYIEEVIQPMEVSKESSDE